ncbi:MAG: TetR/AcrR family transcriptional regulator, partial [Saccharothrix sp.]|nr:TetR/AcrR family transcriptional regulator [Saccharothrix sp.]
AVQITLDLVRGLALANQLTDDGKRRKRIVRHWAQLLEERLGGQAP